MRLVTTALVGATLAVAPATALATYGWYDAGAGVPADVSLHDVAAAPAAVIAVGTEAAQLANGPTTPSIWRLSGGAWYPDTVTLPADAVGASLSAVAIAPAAAWAIGSYADAAGASHPLVVRVGATDLASQAPASWTPVDATPLGTSMPFSVTLTADASDAAHMATGAIGTADGKVFPVADNSGGASIGTALASDVGSPASVPGVAAWPTGGYAVGDDSVTGVPRFYSFDASGMKSQVAVTSDGAVGIRGIAALDSTRAIAIDSTRYWETDGTSWTRRTSVATFANGLSLADVSIADVGGQSLEAITGTNTTASQDSPNGVVWQRLGTGAWTRYDLMPSGLHGIAASANNELWLVGDGGTLMRYFDKPADPSPPPPPPPPPSDTGTGGTTTTTTYDTSTGSGTTTASGTTSGSTPTDSGVAVSVTQPAPATAPQPTTAPLPKRKKKAARRLMTGVSVQGAKGALIVSFNLSAPANVALIAKSGNKVLGTVTAAGLAAGHRRMVLRYRGAKVPSQLKIVVHPAPRSRTGARKTTKSGRN